MEEKQILKDTRNIKEIKLLEELLKYGELGHETQKTRLQQIFEDTHKIFGYFPFRFLTVNVRGLDNKVHENQPVILCNGLNDEAVIGEVPGRERGHPDFRLYTYESP